MIKDSEEHKRYCVKIMNEIYNLQDSGFYHCSLFMNDANVKAVFEVRPWRWKNEKQTGIYFLFREGICVYVGSSVNIWERVAQHRLIKTKHKSGDIPKDFDYVVMMIYDGCGIDKIELEAYEYSIIDNLRPEYNRLMKKPRKIAYER